MKINYNRMKQVCLSPIESFMSLGDVQETRDGIYIYKDNPKAKILGVAHLDSVLDLNHFYTIKEKQETTVINAQLDDRLGVYAMLDILPQLGIEFDLLLTEGEETGRSTGKYFEPSKSYNWMFSFDRRLDDVVMYQYENAELTSSLKDAGFKIGLGSFSDISFMDDLGVRGFNIGVGYDWEHDALCHAYMSLFANQIKRFHAFYNLNEDTKYPYTASSLSAYSSFTKYPDDTCYICEQTSPNGEDINGVWICEECMGNVQECPSCGDMVNSTEIFGDKCDYCRDRGYMR